VVEPILGERGSFRDGEEGMVFEGEVPLSDEFCRWLLSCGDEVEVLAPAALRAALGRRVAAAAAYYDEPGGRGKAAKP
jgi:predicted DNA-binding transcriptional regulator YafY